MFKDCAKCTNTSGTVEAPLEKLWGDYQIKLTSKKSKVEDMGSIWNYNNFFFKVEKCLNYI